MWSTEHNTAQIKLTALEQTQRTRLNLFTDILSTVLLKTFFFREYNKHALPCCTLLLTDRTC